jgi:3-oxoacyl-[acyl-carrier protein] reductase
MQQPDLDGQVVAITGGSRGIGRATAQAALAGGARVALAGRHRARVDEALQALGGEGPRLTGQAVDVRHFEPMADWLQTVESELGPLHGLVNAAGLAWAGSFDEEDPAEMAEQVAVNVDGVLFGCRAALPRMQSRGSGVVVNVSSGAGRVGMPGLATYCATKFAVNGLTEALAAEAGPLGIRVHGICPGRVATEMQRAVSGRVQGMAPERVAEAIGALLGPEPPVAAGQCWDLG